MAAFVAAHAGLADEAGRRRLVRNGFLPERAIQTGIGAGPVRQPRVRDRGAGGGSEPSRFASAIPPRYLRRSRSLDELLPRLDLKGLSTGDFGEALAALPGPDAPGLSATAIGRLKEVRQGEPAAWQARDPAGKRYVCFRADGVCFNARLDQDRRCILGVIGAGEHGRKELVGLTDGYREGEQSWRELLVDLRRRGLEIGPERAVGDGNPGLRKALRQGYGAAREQRCRGHKAVNVLAKLPPGLQAKARQHLQAIRIAETREAAEAASDFSVEAYGAKYAKAVACLAKDRGALLTFHDFPAAHWKQVRTANPIESTSATVRLRTTRTKGCLSRRAALTMVCRLCPSARKRWRRLDGPGRPAAVVRGVRFVDGERQVQDAA